MEKPIVFLSHSTQDKAPLAELKKLLDVRAAGSLDFFLSSDGESIRFGRNWVVRVSDALSRSKLMFVFLSPQSADSKWIHFEAGCAYAKDIQVVPVCLPGIDLNRITPPLSLLQGFNLHSHEAIGNIARICNETFGLKINEAFSQTEFDNFIRDMTGHGSSFFGGQIWAIEAIHLNSLTDVPSDDFNPIPSLHEICKAAGMNCHSSSNGQLPQNISAQIEQPGCIIKFNNYEVKERKPGYPPQEVGTGRRKYKIDCTLSPDLFQINARLLDQWLEQVRLVYPISVAIELKSQIVAEKQRHNFTAKLYRGGIKLVGNEGYEFQGFRFKFGKYLPWKIEFNLDGKLEDSRLSQIIEQLFKSEVLWERQPDFSEMFQGS